MPTVVPRCMSTQHPDNVSTPFFASGPVLGGEDEIREAYYAFSHLGCDEQMWDFEGKEVDAFVVEKLLTAYDAFFRERRLGETLFLTPRVPNPALEPAQAKVLLEVLHSLPRHFDVARLAHGAARPPIFEVIFPMTTSARELDRVRATYRTFVSGVADAVLAPGDPPLSAWFGEFAPRDIAVIPLVEDRPSLLGAADIVRAHLDGASPAYQRVFIARSDPALNYGMASAILLSLVSLARLGRLEAERGIPILPILGVGSAPFRGGLAPDTVARVLTRYPSVQTFTIQSAFKYDHPADRVAAAVATLRAAPRGAPLALDEGRALAVADALTTRYEREIAALAPLVRAVAAHVPRRRTRRLHIGLFGYSRSANGNALPRAISFCASLYAVGIPPEVLGLAALSRDDWEWLRASVPCVESDLRDALRWLDPEVVRDAPGPVAESIVAARRLVSGAPPDAAHASIARDVRARLAANDTTRVGELLTRGASLRRFLG